MVEGQLIKHNESEVPENFVSVAVNVDQNKIPYHAGILIRYLSQDYFFHYPGNIPPVIQDLQQDPSDEIIVYKILENFDVNDSGDVGAFLQHCKRVSRETAVTYGFVLDGSTYAGDGRYESLTGLPEIATCVGFCVNVLTNTIVDVENSYFNLDEWDNSGIPTRLDLWAEQELSKNYPSLDWNLYNTYKKRISPTEYIGSGFCEIYPISKAQINPIVTEVELELENIL